MWDAVMGEGLAELEHEPRLADSRLTHDANRLALALRRAGKQSVKASQLPVAPYEMTQGTPAKPVTGPLEAGQAVRYVSHGGQRRQSFEGEAAPEKRNGCGTDQDRARLGDGGEFPEPDLSGLEYLGLRRPAASVGDVVARADGVEDDRSGPSSQAAAVAVPGLLDRKGSRRRPVRCVLGWLQPKGDHERVLCAVYQLAAESLRPVEKRLESVAHRDHGS